ncbi:NAD-binding protein [Sulfurospirillum barnesii]|uniref:NAD-binding protein n=1 Tax=Sulfurospirillum barnesii TaxID=44674 RepID=UPI0002E33BE9|nr:NAD-binding protein [Sulfurospirillum barnesii]
MAGIKSPYCKAIVSLFENDALNLRIALTSKVLNPNITMAIKSTTKNQTENLMDIGVQIIENPFDIIAEHMHMAINNPNTLKVVRWIYGLCNLYDPPLHLPHGKYIVCGYGRMGKSIYEVLKHNNFEISFAEINPKMKEQFTFQNQPKVLIGDGDDKEMLKALGIDTCVAIIAGTNDDTTNLSILATAKKLNPHIVTIARENELEDFSIFESSNIDTIFIPAKVLINKTINAILNPALDIFIKNIHALDEIHVTTLIKQLLAIDLHPKLFTLKIDSQQAFILSKHCSTLNLPLSLLRTSLKDRNFTNNLIPLMRIRHKEIELLPDWNTNLEQNDIYLFAGDDNAHEHLEYLANNIYEFYFAYYGEEKSFLRQWFSKEKH